MFGYTATVRTRKMPGAPVHRFDLHVYAATRAECHEMIEADPAFANTKIVGITRVRPVNDSILVIAIDAA